MTRQTHFWFWGLSGFFIFFDQSLKYIARSHQQLTYYLIEQRLGWEYFGNPGIAFSIPFPTLPLILITLVILAGLIYALQEKGNYTLFALGAHLVIAGATSNLIDRIFFGITIDYLRINTGIINVADIILVIGTILLFIYWGKKEPHVHQHS